MSQRKGVAVHNCRADFPCALLRGQRLYKAADAVLAVLHQQNIPGLRHGIKQQIGK